MPQRAILHTATRVIRRVTTDPAHPVAADEHAVALAAPIDLAGGPWKLDGGDQQVAATAQESREAGLDEDFNRQRRAADVAELRAALDDAAGDLVVPPKLRRVCAALRAVLR